MVDERGSPALQGGEDVTSIRSYGIVTIDDMKQTRGRMDELSKVHGCTKVFVDAEMMASFPSTFDLFEFGANLPRSMKFAFLIPAHIPDDPFFLETVSRNRGVNFKIFTDRDAALEWLLRRPL